MVLSLREKGDLVYTRAVDPQRPQILGGRKTRVSFYLLLFPPKYVQLTRKYLSPHEVTFQTFLPKNLLQFIVSTPSHENNQNYYLMSRPIYLLLFIAFCAIWIMLDVLTGELYQSQILPVCFIIGSLLLLQAKAPKPYG